jgi:hypothetical protein
MATKKSILLDELCIFCEETEATCQCPLGFLSVQTNPPIQQECYCERQPGGCGLVEWKPLHPRAFQVGLVKKLDSALRRDWREGDDGHMSLEMVVCPAEALWIAKALKANIHKKSKR